MSMQPRAIFHLSFPVRSLPESIAFYRDCLGAELGRVSHAWTDVVLFGHQLTLHAQPAQVLPREARGVRHFGAILDWPAWEALRARVLAYDPQLADGIRLLRAGEPEEHAKLLIEDPDGNLVELKAYRSLATIATALANP